MEIKVSGVYLTDSEGNVKGHPIHKKWLDSVDASTTKFRKKKSSGLLSNSFVEDLRGEITQFDEEAEVYVIESPAALYSVDQIKKRNPEAKIIYLETNWRLYGLEGYNLDKEGTKNSLRAVNILIDSFLLRRKIKKHVDGLITVSEMMEEKLEKLFPDKPIEIIRPLPKNEIDAEPDFGSHNAIFVGQNRDHKGVDILVEAWKEVREQVPDAELFLVGKGHKEEWDKIEGVHVKGYVEDLDEIYSKVELYVHPARLDASPVSTLEAMQAGFPTIVTENTGTKSETYQFKNTCFKAHSSNISDAIVDYFSYNIETKLEMSKKLQEVSHNLGQDNRNFNDCISRIFS